MMPFALLAEAAAPSPEFLGLVVLSLVLLSKWLFQYNRERREEAAAHEPRATPPLHAIYATKLEHGELRFRVDAIDTAVRAGFDRLDGKRSSSIAGLHDDLEAKTTALRLEVKQDIKGVQDRVNEVLRIVSKLEGKIHHEE